MRFGDKVRCPDGNGIIVSIDHSEKGPNGQRYLVLIGEFQEDSSGFNKSVMVWPHTKDIWLGWRRGKRVK